MTETKLKEKTREELEERIEELEDLIHEKGVGSEYLQKVERVQRDLNIALMLGAAATVFGLTAWAVYKTTRK